MGISKIMVTGSCDPLLKSAHGSGNCNISSNKGITAKNRYKIPQTPRLIPWFRFGRFSEKTAFGF